MNSHTEWKFLRVDTLNPIIRKRAADFMIAQIGCRYDLISLILNRKQVDENHCNPGEEYYGNYYYCSELVWAGYRYYHIELDPDNEDRNDYYTRVTPDEIDASRFTYPIIP